MACRLGNMGYARSYSPPTDDPHRQGWYVYCADVRVGWIGQRAGVPKTGHQWDWSCGFYPGIEPGQHRTPA